MASKKSNLLTTQSIVELADTVPLGKRHTYGGEKPQSMNQIAQKIGFSNDEISELKKLYASEFKQNRR